MNKLLILLLISTSIIFLCASTSGAVIFEAKKIPSPQDYSHYTPEAITLPSGHETETNRPTSTSIYFSSSNSAKLPVEVRKRVLENSKDGYLVNELIWILVEIRCLEDRWPKDIEIFENVDENLKILNYSGYYITNCINDTFPCEMKINNTCGLNEKNNTIYIHIPDLKKKQRILYSYSIKPIKTGVFDAETTLRIGGIDSFYSDYYYPIDIWVIEPDFYINVDLDKLEGEPQKDISLTYYLKYKSRNGNSLENHNFTAFVGNISNDRGVTITPQIIPLSFNESNKINKHKVIVKYKENGLYSIPEITIGNDTYFFDEHIEVKKWENKYILEITLFFTIVSLIIGQNLRDYINWINGSSRPRRRFKIAISLITLFILWELFTLLMG